MAQAQKETGDYYQFLITNIGAAARDLEPMSETLDEVCVPSAIQEPSEF